MKKTLKDVAQYVVREKYKKCSVCGEENSVVWSGLMRIVKCPRCGASKKLVWHNVLEPARHVAL